MEDNLSKVPEVIRVALSTFEDMEDLPSLIKGLQLLAWDYISRNVDTGIDQRINGAFIRDYCDLLEFLNALQGNAL
jgi:hypothetical protein